jgi:hypothetical protein
MAGARNDRDAASDPTIAAGIAADPPIDRQWAEFPTLFKAIERVTRAFPMLSPFGSAKGFGV